jgi:hypothetical protein
MLSAKPVFAIRPRSSTQLLRSTNPAAVPEQASEAVSRVRATRRLIPAAISRVMLGTFALFAAYAGNVFPNLMLAILSWVVSEFLSACAEYAKAMYPTVAPVNDRGDPDKTNPLAVPSSEHTRSLARPRLVVISEKARCDIHQIGIEATETRETR